MQQLEHGHPQREHISLGVVRLPRALLRARVQLRAHAHRVIASARLHIAPPAQQLLGRARVLASVRRRGCAAARFRTLVARQSKVTELKRLITAHPVAFVTGNKNIRGLDIAVHHIPFVDVSQTLANAKDLI